MTAREAARTVTRTMGGLARPLLAGLLRELHRAASGDLTDYEHLHRVRILGKRLRYAMEVFAPCFPRKRFRAALDEVKAIADALGERRDADVSIAAMEGFASRLVVTDRHGVQVMVEGMREEQELANERLEPFVRKRRLADLRERIEKLAAAAERRAA